MLVTTELKAKAEALAKRARESYKLMNFPHSLDCVKLDNKTTSCFGTNVPSQGAELYAVNDEEMNN